VGNKFQQKYGMAMGSSLSPIISNVFLEHFEKLALYLAEYEPSLWPWYVDTFVVWPHGPEHLNRLKTIQRVRPIEDVVALFSREPVFLFFHLSSLHDV
jgi:hypothetical protein